MGKFTLMLCRLGIISYCFDLFLLFLICFGFLFAMGFFPNAAVVP